MPDDLAAVLMDPLPAALGLIPPRADFVAAIRAKTRECGALLIADEVLSFRIDYRGACHRWGSSRKRRHAGSSGPAPASAQASSTASSKQSGPSR